MSEKAMVPVVRKLLKGLDPIRVENSAGAGTPDINFGGIYNQDHSLQGWIELKYIGKHNKFFNDIVKIKHFTPQQRVWLKRRWWSSKSSFLLLKIKSNWFLFDGVTASNHVGKVNLFDLYRYALINWDNEDKITTKEFQQCLFQASRIMRSSQ